MIDPAANTAQMADHPNEIGTRIGICFGIGGKIICFLPRSLLYLRCGEGFMGLFGTFMFKQSILLVSTSVKATPILGALLTSEYHWIKPILFSGVCLLLKSYVTVLLKDLCARLH